jgi:hypothetical protein
MKERISKADWPFSYNAGSVKLSLKNRLLMFIEKKTGWRIGEYRNYKLMA